MNKKSQAWGIDLAIASFIFTLSLTLFFVYALNYSQESEEKTDSLFYAGNNIADSLLSEGYPEDWDSSNVQNIGVSSKGKLNETKLDRFKTLAETDYSRTKVLFGIIYDYYFALDENMNLPSGETRGIGKPEVTADTISSENLVKINRFTIYENKPVTAYIYVWEE